MPSWYGTPRCGDTSNQGQTISKVGGTYVSEDDLSLRVLDRVNGRQFIKESCFYQSTSTASYPQQTFNMGPIKHKALLNVDLGEGYGNLKCGPDAELLPLIDIANVACGFHSGDPLIMAETVRACKAHNVLIGAHPGLPDLQGFGRREMKLSPEELTAITIYQVGALKGFLDREGVELNHVKPHGVLYGMMCRDFEVAEAVMKGVPKGVKVFGLAGTEMERAAQSVGVEFW